MAVWLFCVFFFLAERARILSFDLAGLTISQVQKRASLLVDTHPCSKNTESRFDSSSASALECCSLLPQFILYE